MTDKLFSYGEEVICCSYYVPADPIALARARFGKGRVYDCQKELKQAWGILIAKQHGRMPLFTGPVSLEISFFFGLPKSISKKKRTTDRPHIIKPDLSNLIKFVEDVGNGIIYRDDRQITSIRASKKYSLEPRVEWTVTRIE